MYSKIEKVLNEINSLLKKEGLVLDMEGIGAPYVYPEENPDDVYYLRNESKFTAKSGEERIVLSKVMCILPLSGDVKLTKSKYD